MVSLLVTDRQSGQGKVREALLLIRPTEHSLADTRRHRLPSFPLITLLTKVDMHPPPHQESTTRQQQQQQRGHLNISTASTTASALASPARDGHTDSHGDTELSSTGTNFRAASATSLAASSEQQSTNQPPLYTRPAPHGHNTNLRTTASSNGNGINKSNTDKATTGGANAAAAVMGMGDGIINQSMKEDLDSKPTEPR